MAIWQDPRTTARSGGVNAATVGVPSVTRDAGLRSYMLSVYNYMASGVLLTGIVALGFANSSLINLIVNPATGQATTGRPHERARTSVPWPAWQMTRSQCGIVRA